MKKQVNHMDIQHSENQQQGEFFMERDGRRVGELTYAWRSPDQFVIDHTWVCPSMRGHGVARHLLDAAVAFARDKQVKIIPVCSYVVVMFQREASFADVWAK